MNYMKKKLFFLLIFISVMGCQDVLAQQTQTLSTNDKKAKQYFTEAMNALRNRKYAPAVQMLQKAVERDDNFTEAHYQLAVAFKMNGKHDLAFHHYRRYAALNPKDTKVLIQLGVWSLEKGHYNEARKYFEKAQEQPFLEGIDRNAVETGLATCHFADSAMQKPLNITPRLISPLFNQNTFQYYPAVTANETEIFYTARIGKGNNLQEDILYSHKKNNEWTEPVAVSPLICKPATNEGTCAIAADGQTMVFTICEGRKDLRGNCDLYISYRNGNEWSEPVNLGDSINTPFWDSQPSLSADGQTLFYASRQRNGSGNSDIWFSQKKLDGTWKKARNLGTIINTAEDEIAPFIHPNGTTLYFASRGHIGLGNYDIFKSEKINGIWQKPQNLGYPLNTHSLETGLSVNPEGTKAYYSKAILANGISQSSQLYEFDLPAVIAPQRKARYVSGTVTHFQDKTPLAATITLIDTKTNEPIYQVQSDATNGNYLMILPEGNNYALYVQKEGFLFQSLRFEAQNSNVNVPISLMPLQNGSNTVLNNTLFDYNKWDLLPESQTELLQLVAFLQQNKALKIEISGHTDDLGETAYNLQLSEKRAKAVYDFLLKKGVDAKQMSYKGYGKSQPAYVNDTDENRKKNRRIELKIIQKE